MIIHSHIPLPADGGPFVFAQLGMFSCSICAKTSMTKTEVEAFAAEQLGRPVGGWVSVDKSRAIINLELVGLGTPTPNPCNHAADRQHWFLFDAINAYRLFRERGDA